MHKLIKQQNEQNERRLQNEIAAVEVNNKLKDALGVTSSIFEEIKRGQPIDVGYGYVVVKQSRCFSWGWVDLLEISLSECPNPGYTNKENNPYWIAELGGTTTTNVPPETVVTDVINLINEQA